MNRHPPSNQQLHEINRPSLARGVNAFSQKIPLFEKEDNKGIFSSLD
jgi:hypothetical protein